jgi:hypothetical protein
LTLLLVLQGPRREKSAQREEPDPGASTEVPDTSGPPEPSEPPAPDEGAQEPPDSAQQVVPGGISGSSSIVTFDKETGRQVYRFRADLENQGGGRYLARDVHVDVFDPAEGKLTETIDAELGRLRIELSGTDIRIADEGRLDLEVVTVQRPAEGPFAPLTLRSPTLRVTRENREMRSGEGDVVVLDGDGLKGSGEGFFVEESAGRFALEQGGELRIELGERGHVVLSTPDRGPIVVQRSPESGEYELRASQNARLAFWPLGADAEQQPQAVLQAA